MKYIKTELKEFISSFKLDATYLQVILYDLIFYAATIPTLLLFGGVTKTLGSRIDQGLMTQEALLAASQAELQAFYSSLKWLVMWTIFSLILMFVVTLTSWSVSRGLIYTKLLNKKFNKSYFWKSIGLALVLGIIVFPLLLLISLFLKSFVYYLIVFSGVFLLAIAYFLAMIYIEFTKSKLVFASIGSGLTQGCKKLPRLILPILFIAVIGIIVGLANNALPKTIVVTLIVLVLFWAWARMYFVKRVESIT